MRAQRIKLNLIPGGVIPVVNVSQYDVGRPLEFALYDGQTVATIESGTVIDIRATKPDGTGFEYACTWSGNVVNIATQAQMTVLSGSIECELHLVKNAQEIGTANFILEVEHAALRGNTEVSETELPDIIDLARSHEQAAAASAEAAAESESNAADSASAAATSESNAADSASAAAESESNAADSASAAAESESNAADSASAAATSESNAAASEAAAATSKSDAEAYAVGKRNGTDVPSTDVTYNNNAKHYAEAAAQAAAGGLIPQGTTTFAQLPALADVRVGYMWNISDDFTTTSDFREGAGVKYGAGANVYKTADGHWDVLAARSVTGVKGANENSYRKGDVEIGYGNLGINPISTGGTGASTEAGARQNFFGEDLSSLVQYVIGITTSWAKGGYLTLQQLRNKLGLGNTLGALPVANGGTGATTAANARTNLEVKKLYAKTISNKSNFKTVVVEAVSTINNLSNENKYTAYIYIAGNGNAFGKYILDYYDGTNYRFTKVTCNYASGSPIIDIHAIGCTSSGGAPWGTGFYENASGGIAASDTGIATGITSATLYYYA